MVDRGRGKESVLCLNRTAMISFVSLENVLDANFLFLK